MLADQRRIKACSRAAIGAECEIADDKLDDATRHVRKWVWGSMLILLLLAVATEAMTVKP